MQMLDTLKSHGNWVHLQGEATMLFAPLGANFDLNPLYMGGLFHYYMFDKSICHFRGVRSILLCFYSVFDGKSF